MSGVKIDRYERPSHLDKRGEWYVCRTAYCKTWDVETAEYLHDDGEWRRSTFHVDRYSGYFATEKDAKAALEQYALQRNER